MSGGLGGLGEMNHPGLATHEDVFSDPAFIVPVIVSCLAVIAILVAITLCLKRSKF